MLSKNKYEGRFQVSVHSLDELVPKNYLVRKIENTIDFNYLIRDKYSAETGRPSVDPVVLIKIVLIQFVQEQSKKYQEQFEEEINGDRIRHGKKPLGKKPELTLKEMKVSTTDPESGLFVKGGKSASLPTRFTRHAIGMGLCRAQR